MIFGAVVSVFGAEKAEARRTSAEAFADFEAAYGQYKDVVRRTAYSIGGAEDLDDIVQDSFIKIWKSWRGFRGEADLKTWVYRVTINASREHWRKRGRYKAAIARFLEEPHKAHSEGGQRGWELRQSLAGALESLSYEHREAVTLVYLEGLSLAEAAEASQTPEGTLKSRLFHARKSLAAALGEGGGNHE